MGDSQARVLGTGTRLSEDAAMAWPGNRPNSPKEGEDKSDGSIAAWGCSSGGMSRFADVKVAATKCQSA